jgi:hypothetical protein
MIFFVLFFMAVGVVGLGLWYISRPKNKFELDKYRDMEVSDEE